MKGNSLSKLRALSREAVQRHNEKDGAATNSFTDEEERDKDWREALLTTPEHASLRERFVVPQGGVPGS